MSVKDGIKYAIQCKNYASALSNTPVQEVSAGKQFYGCHVGVVMTNSTFTPGAIQLAAATNVLLWDRRKLDERPCKQNSKLISTYIVEQCQQYQIATRNGRNRNSFQT